MNDADRMEEREAWVPDHHPAQRRWSHRSQRIASTVWPSFMVAVIASMIFFSLFDAELLGLAMMPERDFSALTGYGICFFFFWIIALLSSSTTLFLRRTRRRRTNDDEEPLGYQADDFNQQSGNE